MAVDEYVSFPDATHPYFLYMPRISMQFYATESARDAAWAALTAAVLWETMPTEQGHACVGTCTAFLLRPDAEETKPLG